MRQSDSDNVVPNIKGATFFVFITFFAIFKVFVLKSCIIKEILVTLHNQKAVRVHQ